MNFSMDPRDAVPGMHNDSKRINTESSRYQLKPSGSTRRKQKFPPLYERKRAYQLNFNYNFTQQEAQDIHTKGEASLQAVELLIKMLLNTDSGENFSAFNPMQSPIMSGKSPLMSGKSQVSNTLSPRSNENNANTSSSMYPDTALPERIDSVMDAVLYSDCSHVYINLKKYMKKSTLYTFWNGKRIGPEEIDSVLTTFTIVNALLLWLPFNMIGYLGFQFWDWFQNTLDYCPNTVTVYLEVYNSMENALFINLFGSICGIIISIVYFICRPTDVERFHKWWKRGRWGVLLNMIFTLMSIVGIMTNFTLMTTSYMNSSSNLCASYSTQANQEHYQSAYSTAFIVLGLSIALSFLVMI